MTGDRKNKLLAWLSRSQKRQGTTVFKSRCALFAGCLIFLRFHTFANTNQLQLPPEVALNRDAGRMGWWLLPLKMTNGQELLFVVDTGAPATLLDQSMESKLEKACDDTGNIDAIGKHVKSGVYKTPKLLLGNVPLLTGSNCFVFPCDSLSRWAGRKVMGILGMDCLCNYCLQLDFEAGKARFLDSTRLDTNALGKAYAMEFLQKEGVPPQDSTDIVPFLHQPGFFGTKSKPLLLDLGDDVDGGVENGAIHGHYVTRLAHLLRSNHALHISHCVWDGESYTDMLLDQGNYRPNRLGIRFFARHLTTFDFPNKTLYLKRVSAEPLRTDDLKKAIAFFKKEVKHNRLPGLADLAHFDYTANFKLDSAPNSVSCEARLKGSDFVYHYEFAYAPADKAWKLKKAWRTDKENQVKDYPVEQALSKN
jgi:hypothetical protein